MHARTHAHTRVAREGAGYSGRVCALALALALLALALALALVLVLALAVALAVALTCEAASWYESIRSKFK